MLGYPAPLSGHIPKGSLFRASGRSLGISVTSIDQCTLGCPAPLSGHIPKGSLFRASGRYSNYSHSRSGNGSPARSSAVSGSFGAMPKRSSTAAN